MIDRLAEVARVAPDRVAIDGSERSWSYSELHAASERMGRRLWPLGAQPGEVVALVAHPNATAIQALHAVPRTGASIAPLNPALGRSAIENALDRIGPSLIVTCGSAADEAGLPASWVVHLDELRPADPDLPGRERSPGYRLWTSGTAGRPRIVEVPLAALDASAEAVARRLQLNADDRWYASLSPAHVGGLALIYRAVHVGCTIVTTGRFDVRVMDELMDEGRITHASLVPTQLLRFLDRREGRPPPPAVRCLLVGGASASPELVDRSAAAGLPIALTYGLTEATSQVATAPPAMVEESPGTVGYPLDGLEVRLGADQEIFVRGDTVVPSSADEDGWLATGDLGRVDDLGRLWVTGRKSAVIISGGVNVDPTRVEAVLSGCEGVSQAAVVGLADAEWGQCVAALVVPETNASLDPKRLLRAAGPLLSKAERPRVIRFAERLPLNANGKVDVGAVRAALAREE